MIRACFSLPPLPSTTLSSLPSPLNDVFKGPHLPVVADRANAETISVRGTLKMKVSYSLEEQIIIPSERICHRDS